MFFRSKVSISDTLLRLLPLSRNQRVREFYKFAIVGISNTLIDFAIYFLLTRFTVFFGEHIIYANVISFSVAVTNSYFWNRRWTFRSIDQRRVQQYIKFVIVNCIGLGINSGLLYIFAYEFHIHDLLGKALAVIVTLFWNFLINRLWVFRNS
jgi:putative flippase GtrA